MFEITTPFTDDVKTYLEYSTLNSLAVAVVLYTFLGLFPVLPLWHDHSAQEHAKEAYSIYFQIDVMLFDKFKGIEQIEVQVIIPKKQTALELTAKDHRIML